MGGAANYREILDHFLRASHVGVSDVEAQIGKRERENNMFKAKKGMKALVVGLGRSGVAATKLLCKKGIKVTVTDELNKSDLKESLDALESFDYRSELGKHVLKTFWEQDFTVVSTLPNYAIRYRRKRDGKVFVMADIQPLNRIEKDQWFMVYLDDDKEKGL